MASGERVAVDTGGTFTDCVRIVDGVITVVKELSTPDAPDRAILAGIARLDSGAADRAPNIAKADTEIIHGSTVATNALLERRGAPTALVTTAGFEDVLVIGRQTRRDLYDIFTTRPAPLVADDARIGALQRTLYDGTRHIRLTGSEIRRVVSRVRELGVESVAVVFLFSFVDPDDERRIGAALAKLGLSVSLSSTILPEYREFERTSTTVINAYLAPVMQRYLGRLAKRAGHRRLRVMQSNGGTASAASAMEAPVRTILSGPAGGVVGAFETAGRAGYTRLITFDMGGTSTDVALLDGEVRVTRESVVDGMPIGVPMIDMHTVGAGGGSIAREDAGGALRVGPESAGADPGPICYGSGTELTVTDANLILGRLLPRFFLGGGMALAPERIRPAVGRLRWARHWKGIEELAEGVVDVVNHTMEQAIRLISVERGYDPRDFSMVTFGGAGGLHAAALAAALGIGRVIVPPHPGALSAVGLLLADARKDYARTLLGGATTPGRLRTVFGDLHRQGMADLRNEGVRRSDIWAADFLDVRYAGQSYELTVPYQPEWESDFHRRHAQRYGHSSPSSPVEIVSARSAIVGKTTRPRFARARTKRRSRPRPVASERLWIQGRWTPAAIYDRSTLGYGHVLDGPAVVGEYSSTTLVPPGFRCEVDTWGNLILTAVAFGPNRGRRQ
jgi:N-methylhydantoinase A